jgi:DNA-binding MarR family transcriptional regulator
VAGERDRREMHLRLTRAGARMYAQLVPLALARERALLACMSAADRRALLRALERLERFLALREAPDA